MSAQTALTPDSWIARRWDLVRKADPIEDQIAYANIASPLSAQRVPMWLFVSGNSRLLCRRPVEVEISRDDDDSVLVSCERLHVFADGESYEKAIESFHEQVIHFFREYTALDEGDLIGRAIEIRNLYRQHFELTSN